MTENTNYNQRCENSGSRSEDRRGFGRGSSAQSRGSQGGGAHERWFNESQDRSSPYDDRHSGSNGRSGFQNDFDDNEMNFDSDSGDRRWEENSGSRGGYQEPDFEQSRSQEGWRGSRRDQSIFGQESNRSRGQSSGSSSYGRSGFDRDFSNTRGQGGFAGNPMQSQGWQGSSGQRDFGSGNFGHGSFGQGSFGQGNRNQGQNQGQGSMFGSSFGTDYNSPYGDQSHFSGNSTSRDWERVKSNSGSGTGSNRGGFFGKGPKGYTRSDERIKEDLNERLASDWEIDASDITVEVKSGEVTLTGTVDSRQVKYRVEELAEEAMGVKDVNNQLRVKRASSSDERTTGQSNGLAQSGSSSSKQQDSGSSSRGKTSGSAQH